jgi:glycosylphosphatidylinositol transamidase (GPIT) subunit GPI8
MPIYSDAVNTSSNLKMEVAKSVAYGMGVNFCLTDGFVADSDDFDEYKLYATVFEDNVQKINDILIKDNFAQIHDSVADSALVGYEFVNETVVKSEFENGVVIYTNLSTQSADSPVGELQPYEYKVG